MLKKLFKKIKLIKIREWKNCQKFLYQKSKILNKNCSYYVAVNIVTHYISKLNESIQ